MKSRSIKRFAAPFLFILLSTPTLILAFGPDRGPSELPAPLLIPQQAVNLISGVTKDDIPKLSPLLNQVYQSHQKIGIPQAADSMKRLMIAEKFVYIVVEIRPGKTEEVSALIQRLGGYSVNRYRDFVFGTFPVDQLPELAASTDVYRVRTPSRSFPDTFTEGRNIHNATVAQAAGHTGQGVKVGYSIAADFRVILLY